MKGEKIKLPHICFLSSKKEFKPVAVEEGGNWKENFHKRDGEKRQWELQWIEFFYFFNISTVLPIYNYVLIFLTN